MKKITQKGFRTWKSGKQWLFMGVTIATLLTGLGVIYGAMQHLRMSSEPSKTTSSSFSGGGQRSGESRENTPKVSRLSSTSETPPRTPSLSGTTQGLEGASGET
ncbi:KxYKxGKxW signal peptide domain-containing protein, partial [Streptococcus castoreus]|uniref:KxYKxGKxW signal peptide domain-containing protein n=1 Tax=Streptococcus castoreus TaxID=254786 RepID=UPI0005632A93